MTYRDPACIDCHQVTSGDCGKHNVHPILMGSSCPSCAAKDAQIAALETEVEMWKTYGRERLTENGDWCEKYSALEEERDALQANLTPFVALAQAAREAIRLASHRPNCGFSACTCDAGEFPAARNEFYRQYRHPAVQRVVKGEHHDEAD